MRAGAQGMTTAALGLVVAAALVLGPTGAAGNTMPLGGEVDLSVGVAAQPNPVPVGSVVHYEGVIRNRGTIVAEDVKAVFEIPAARVAAEASSQSCIVLGSTRLERDGTPQDKPWTVICNLGTLPPAAEIRVALSVTTGPHGTHLTVATLSSRQADARPSDNAVETRLFVLPDTPGFSSAFQQPARPNPLGRIAA